MKKGDWIHLPLAALLAAAASFLTASWTADRGARAEQDDLPQRTLQLEQQLAALEHGQTTLARELAAWTAAEDAAPAAGRVEVDRLEAEVARWLEANAARLATGAEPAARARAAEDAIADAVDRLLARRVDDEVAFWADLRARGLLDGVITALEETVAESPHDPDMRVVLAGAYMQKVFELGPGPLQALYSEQADQAYDEALRLDEGHWDARFGKALALSNWPSFLGKSGEALHQFEVLLQQQEDRPAEPRFSNTYFFLGNLYLENGDREKALATWSRGLDRFPDSERLRARVDDLRGGGF